MSDIIPFNQSVKFGIEHGFWSYANDSPGTYSSVTYYYKTEGRSPALTLVSDLDLGDVWTEDLYDYKLSSSGTTNSNVWFYEGDEDHVAVADEGYAYGGTATEFTVPLAENMGLLLRRRTDQGIGGQKAHVFVDDVYAGIWYEADHNFASVDKRWLDSDFMVSSNLVSGKTSARITIVPLSSSNLWNEYRYWIYCVKPMERVVDSDADGLPDDWELQYVPALEDLEGGVDSDEDGYVDSDEYIAGTDPSNPGSNPRILAYQVEQGITFETELGRLYTVQESTNLLSGDWNTFRSNVPGTGSQFIVPPTTNTPASFYRFHVEKP